MPQCGPIGRQAWHQLDNQPVGPLLTAAPAPRLSLQEQAPPLQSGLTAPQPSSLRTSCWALCITRIEIKESVIYTAEGDRGSSSRKARISLRLNRRVRWMRRTVGSLEKSISITRLTLAVSSAETRRAEGTATALAVLCSTA